MNMYFPGVSLRSTIDWGPYYVTLFVSLGGNSRERFFSLDWTCSDVQIYGRIISYGLYLFRFRTNIFCTWHVYWTSSFYVPCFISRSLFLILSRFSVVGLYCTHLTNLWLNLFDPFSFLCWSFYIYDWPIISHFTSRFMWLLPKYKIFPQ